MSSQIRSGVGTYVGAARRRVHPVTVILRPPSGHRPGRRQARHVHILQMGPCLAIAQADAKTVMPISFRYVSGATMKSVNACSRRVQYLGFPQDKIRCAGFSAGSRAACPRRRSWRFRTMRVKGSVYHPDVLRSTPIR